MQHGKIPIMSAATCKLVEILFSWTKPIPSLPDWNVDAIIKAMRLKAKVCKRFLMGISLNQDCRVSGGKKIKHDYDLR
jgi:hypothetical protein